MYNVPKKADCDEREKNPLQVFAVWTIKKLVGAVGENALQKCICFVYIFNSENCSEFAKKVCSWNMFPFDSPMMNLISFCSLPTCPNLHLTFSCAIIISRPIRQEGEGEGPEIWKNPNSAH